MNDGDIAMSYQSLPDRESGRNYILWTLENLGYDRKAVEVEDLWRQAAKDGLMGIVLRHALMDLVWDDKTRVVLDSRGNLVPAKNRPNLS